MGFARPRSAPPTRLVASIVAWLVIALSLSVACPVRATPDAAVVEDRAPAEIRLGDDTVFVVRVERSGLLPAARARKTTQLLEQTLEQPGERRVRFATEGPLRVLYVGTTPLLQLTPEDAKANGDASVDVTASRVAARLRTAIAHEQKRARISHVVFTVSLAVFAALAAWLLIRRVTILTRAARIRIKSREKAGRALSLGGVELATPRAAARLFDALLVTASVLVRIGALLAWTTFALSLFPATLAVRSRLVHALVTPISGSIATLTSLAKSAIVGLVFFAVVAALLRIVGAFFDAIARGDARVAWLDPTHAQAFSTLVRLAIVLGALALASPLFDGRGEILSKMFGAFLVALAIGAAPSLASAAIGARLVFGGLIRVGDEVRVLEHRGRVESLGLFDFALRDEHGAEVRIAYAPLLLRPLEVLARSEHDRGSNG